jgi:IS30 family transposase
VSKLTEQDWQGVDELLEKGVTHEEIAEIYGVHAVTIARHASTVENRKNKMKVPLEVGLREEILRRVAAGEHKKEIAATLGVHWSTVYREARKAAKVKA